VKDFQAKRNVKRLIYSWWTIAILVIINSLLIRSNLSLWSKVRYTAKNEARAEKEYNDVLARHMVLTADIQRLNSPEGVDLELRRKYQMVKPGEQTVVIVGEIASSSNSRYELEEKTGIWENLLRWLGL